jgi:hypothetical protein
MYYVFLRYLRFSIYQTVASTNWFVIIVTRARLLDLFRDLVPPHPVGRSGNFRPSIITGRGNFCDIPPRVIVQNCGNNNGNDNKKTCSDNGSTCCCCDGGRNCGCATRIAYPISVSTILICQIESAKGINHF